MDHGDTVQLIQRTGLAVREVAEELHTDPSTVHRWMSGRGRPSNANYQLSLRLAGEPPVLSVPETPWFRFIDLFAGIGGLRLGLEAIGGRCVFTAERDKYAQMTYRRNFGPEEIHPDVRTIDPSDYGLLPEFDVLAAGFPCQPFSLAGVSKKNALGRPHGFDDLDQGNLFFKIAEIVEQRRPAMVILENVKNLLSHDRGNTFRAIRTILVEHLGYSLTARVIDARHWVPQHRERIFLVAFRQDVGCDLHGLALPTTSRPVLADILHGHADDVEPHPRYTLSPALWDYLQRYAEKHRAAGNGFGYGLVGPADVSRTLSARYHKDGSEILVRQDGPPRRLTPRECARLMGFRHHDGREWEIPVSDTQAYRQFGNAVVVPAVKAVAQYVQPYLGQMLGVPVQQSMAAVA